MDASSYRVLRWKIVGLALCFSLIPLFVLGFSIYYQFDVWYTAGKIMQNLRAMAGTGETPLTCSWTSGFLRSTR